MKSLRQSVVSNHKPKSILALVISMVFISGVTILGQAKPERVRFSRGASSITLRGRIVGYGTKDYVISAKAGQVMKLHLSTTNSYTNFFIYSINGRQPDMPDITNDWSQKLSESGDYVIRVFMMRAGARKKGAAADYTLSISIQ